MQRGYYQPLYECLKEAGILCPILWTPADFEAFPASYDDYDDSFNPATGDFPYDANEDDFYFIEDEIEFGEALPNQYASGFDRSFAYHAAGPKSPPHVLWSFTARGLVVIPILAKVMPNEGHGYYVSAGDDQGNFFALAAQSGKQLLTFGSEGQKEAMLDCYVEEEEFGEQHGYLAVTRKGSNLPLFTTLDLNELPEDDSRDDAGVYIERAADDDKSSSLLSLLTKIDGDQFASADTSSVPYNYIESLIFVERQLIERGGPQMMFYRFTDADSSHSSWQRT